MTFVPEDTPVTIPAAFIVATAGLLTDQLPPVTAAAIVVEVVVHMADAPLIVPALGS
jgi:hypothetical protein